MKTIFIYELIDPITDETRYIGKTCNPSRRLKSHFLHVKNNLNCTYKENWIKSLKKRNLKPVLNIIDEVKENESNFWERFYISLYKSWNCKLTNLTDGGDGSKGMLGKHHSEETKKRMSLIKINKPTRYWKNKTRVKKTCKKISLTLKSKYKKLTEKEKQIVKKKNENGITKAILKSPRNKLGFKQDLKERNKRAKSIMKTWKLGKRGEFFRKREKIVLFLKKNNPNKTIKELFFLFMSEYKQFNTTNYESFKYILRKQK